MAKRTITRKELLNSPDEFLTFSERVVQRLSAYRRQIKIGGVVLAVLCLAYLGVYGYFRHVNSTGQELYNQAAEALPQAPKPGENPTEQILEAEKRFQKVIEDAPRSRAARLALPQIAHAKFVEKKYEEAIALYEAYLKKVTGEPQYENLVYMAMASTYEAKGTLEKAREYLQKILDRSGNPFEATAMLGMIRLYHQERQTEKAKELAKAFSEKFKDSPFLPLAKAYL